MLVIYRTLINIVFILSPLIIVYRIFKKKEDPNRFWEKFCFFSDKKNDGNLVWFHGASVGEIQSIVPLLEKIEKNKKIKKILITSNTLSSSKIVKKLKLKKIVHQFFPIDTNFHSKKFLEYWKPTCSFFIDSEIWPNMILNLKKKEVPIILLNGRITKKTFKKWKIFSNFARKIFGIFDLCLSSSIESKKYLNNLGAKKVKYIGNLKFSQSEKKESQISKNLKQIIKSKKTWCASSTHNNEEQICGNVHMQLKKKYKDLLTIIIPRHTHRVDNIEDELKKLKLVSCRLSSNQNMSRKTDILIVDSYGKTKSFYHSCKNVFLGGSLINHGGQNPLEAARYGCNILHGPNVFNFKEIYKFLKINKMSIEVNNQKKMIYNLNNYFKKKASSKKIQKKLNLIGKKILSSTHNEINQFLNNEI